MLLNEINKRISGMKGNAYTIDARIPVSYTVLIVLRRIRMLLNGQFSGVKHGGMFFLSSAAGLRCRSKLVLGRSVTIDRGAFVDALSVEGIHLANNVSVGINTRIEGTGNLQHLGKGMSVGANSGLGCDSFYGCSGGIEIGCDTIIGNSVSFHSENHVFGDLQIPIRLQGVHHQGIKVGSNCWIGAKSTILDGASIEDGCVIAAGALVKAGLYTGGGVYGGVPAKLLKKRSEEVLYHDR